MGGFRMDESRDKNRKLSLSDRISIWFEFNFMSNIGWYMLGLAIILITFNHLGLLKMSSFSSNCSYGRNVDGC